MIPTVRVGVVSGGSIVAVTIDETSPFGSVVSIVVVTGVAEGNGVGMFSRGIEVVREDPPPTFAGARVVPTELVGRIALGKGDAPIGSVVVETTPFVVTGQTNWNVVITRTFRDMESVPP
jgi:hypothetical protein